MEQYNTKVTLEDLLAGIKDEYGVIYSKDGKRLLRCTRDLTESYFVHEGVEVICDYAFFKYWIYNKKEIILPDSLKAIGDCSFKDCLMRNFKLPDGLEYIGKMAFFYTHLLISELKLPTNLEFIGDYAFGYSDISSVSLPESLNKIGIAPFATCYDLKRIKLNKKNKEFVVKDGILYDIHEQRLIQNPALNSKNYKIPKTVTSCDKGAFYFHDNLEKVPARLQGKWELLRMKDIVSLLINRPCGIKDYGYIEEIGNFSSIKLSNSIYFNILDTDYTDLYKFEDSSKVIDFFHLLNFFNYDITKKLGLTEEVKINKRNYRQYINRILSDHIRVIEDVEFFDLQTGDIYTEPLENAIFCEGHILKKETFNECFTRLGDSFIVKLYKEHLQYNEIREALSSFNYDINISDYDFFISVEMEAKKELFEAIYNTCIRLKNDTLLGKETNLPITNISPDDDTCWNELIEEFFDIKIQRVRKGNVSQSRFWKDMERFLVSKGVDRRKSIVFTSSLSFVFKPFYYDLRGIPWCKDTHYKNLIEKFETVI